VNSPHKSQSDTRGDPESLAKRVHRQNVWRPNNIYEAIGQLKERLHPTRYDKPRQLSFAWALPIMPRAV
jgi:hypothetical protein